MTEQKSPTDECPACQVEKPQQQIFCEPCFNRLSRHSRRRFGRIGNLARFARTIDMQARVACSWRREIAHALKELGVEPVAPTTPAE